MQVLKQLFLNYFCPYFQDNPSALSDYTERATVPPCHRAISVFSIAEKKEDVNIILYIIFILYII